MKKFNRILGIVTAVIMIFSLFTIPAAIAADDAASITFDMISEEAPVAVTKNLNLISTLGSTAVTWASNNTAVIGLDGSVTRGANDTKVILSAMVGQTTKSFEVIVPGTNTNIGCSEGYTNSSALAEYVIESSSSARYGSYSEATGTIVGSDATVSVADGKDMVITQTGTGQSRVNRPFVSGATGLSGIVVVEKRIKASHGFNWYIKAADNMTIAQLLRTGTTLNAGNNAVVDSRYISLPANEYVTYKIVLDTNTRTYSVYINDVLPGENFKNIAFMASRNNVAKCNDWIENYPRSANNTLKIDYTAVTSYSNYEKAVSAIASSLTANDLLGDNLSVEAVAGNLNLPTIINDVEISWSSNSALVTANGAVSRGDSDADVVLTATFTKGTYTATKEYNFTVIKSGDIVLDATDFTSLEGYRGFASQDGETARLGSGFNRKISNLANPGKGLFSIDGRFMIKSVSGKDSEIQVRMPGSPSNAQHLYPVTIFLKLTIDNKLTVTVKDGEKTTDAISNMQGIISHNEWFDLRVEYDTDLCKYYLFINDNIVTNECMSLDIVEGTNYFTAVIFGAAGTTDAYIDGYTYKKVSALTYDEVFSKSFIIEENGNEISDLNDVEGNSVSVSAEIFNPDAVSENIYMIVASYSNGALYDCIIKPVTISADRVKDYVTTDRELSVPDNKETATIKCFTIERDRFVPFGGEEFTMGYSFSHD